VRKTQQLATLILAALQSLLSVLLLGEIALGVFAGSAAAQTLTGTDRAQLEAQKQALFNQMLNNPGNLDVTFAYADVAARLGDNEAAVAALERMLLFNANLPRVDLELGALYFRMGSFDVARTYFQKVLASNPPPEIKERVNIYLSQISVQVAPERLTGLLFSGVQYQSDANVAPGASLINSPLGPVLLNNQFVKGADANIFGSGSVLYTYDLGNQSGDAIEATGNAFINHYFRFDRLDLGFAEVTAGPRFNFPAPTDGVKNASFKPYAILNEVGLGENQYFWTYGVGAEWTAQVFDDVSVRTVFEFRQKKFSNAPERPLSTGLDGSDKIVSFQVKKPITANSEINLQFDYLNQSTQFPWYANQSYAGTAAYRIRYDDPTGTLPFPWETAAYFSRIWSLYDAPDPCCNTSSIPGVVSFSTRDDRRWRFGISQTFQVMDNVAIVVQFQRDIVSSNIPLYAYTSNSVLVGPQIRF
jgi:hypothetical protein